mgnify:CR=1 FL=1
MVHAHSDRPLGPDRHVQPPAPPLGPSASPEGTTDNDTNDAKPDASQCQKEAEAVNTQCADRVANEVTEERILMLGCLDDLPFARVGG